MAYVAKDATYARACHVLECGGGLAQDVLTTVGQAFELRFKVGLFRSLRDAHNTIRTFVFRRDRVLSGPETGGYTRSKVTGLRVQGGPKEGGPRAFVVTGPKILSTALCTERFLHPCGSHLALLASCWALFRRLTALFLSTTEFTNLSRTIILQGWVSDVCCMSDVPLLSFLSTTEFKFRRGL